jgi:hypothetical protein
MAGKKGLYRVFLMNRCNQDRNKRWNGTVFNEICSMVEDLFKQVIARPECPFGEARCFPAGPGTNMDPGELLAYFLPDKRSSIIRSNGGANASLEAGGATWDSGRGIISEVYVDDGLSNAIYKELFARIVFHELMHNKLDASSGTTVLNDLHTDGGAGLASSPVAYNTAPTNQNKSLMARNLASPMPQFTGGLGSGIVSVNGNPWFIDGEPVRSPDSGPVVTGVEAGARAAD